MPEYPLLPIAGVLIAYVRVSGPGGSRLLRLALDTGATTTMVPPKAALAIGVTPARATAFRETITASGTECIPLIKIPRFRLFEKDLSGVSVACHALPSESPVDGLLGLDILKRLAAVIDVAKPSLRIT
ncbi:MAG: retroviral-like aspartic protease family protein [Elusimicrobia bacterium]|nr:retroviral-like aspartic protease family protein [Elusimicrobiota bacterium]